ncbi:MAG: hypothetical protein JW737_01410 [Acidobacteria bacterium]|nr:hypothetical protein [Acidobacteriota bacterium]
MRNIIAVLAALFFISFLFISCAHSYDEQDRPPREMPNMKLMTALDLNDDGSLSLDEIKKAPESLLTLDTNKDGYIKMDEMMDMPNRMGGSRSGSNMGMRGGGGMPGGNMGMRGTPQKPPLIKALDVNEDNVISPEEIKNSYEYLRLLDKNDDGIISKDELMGPPPGGREGENRREGDRPEKPNEEY